MSTLPLLFRTKKSCEIIKITPEIARDWLTFNKRNRRISPITLDKYIQTFTDGLYQFNGDSIRWSADGILLDGQNRLTALAETGVTIESVVVWGVRPEAQITMDRGRKRSLIDHLTIHGETGTKELATVLNLAVDWYERGSRFGLGAGTVQFEEAYAYLQRNPEVRDSVAAASIGSGSSQLRKVINPAHYSFLHWVFSNIDAADAEDFLLRVARGTYAEDTDPAYRLRLRLLDLRSERADRPHQIVPLACKAWNLYRAGEPVSQLRIRRGGAAPEAFPEPK